MPLDTHSYLTSRGWKGTGNALREGGLERPVVQAQKKDLKGVGKNRDDGFQFWGHVYGVAASAIQVVIHNDDEGDKEKEEEIEDSEDSKNSMPIASSVNAGEGRGQRQLRGSHTLEITQTGILSNRRPSQRSGDPSSGGDRLVAAASNGNLLALAKREAAKRELYSRFSRGEVIFGDPLGGDLLDDDPPAKATDTADDHKAQERRRKEEKRARKEKRRLERETGREKAIKRRK